VVLERCGAPGRRGPRWRSGSDGDEGAVAVALKGSWHGGGGDGKWVPARQQRVLQSLP
jgi:hypothetical protein